jgi:outer membrane protein
MIKRNKFITNATTCSFLVLLLLVGKLGNAQATNEFTLQQTVDYGLKNAVQVKNALLDIQIQKQTNREITALAMPQINGSVNATHYFNIPVTTLPNFISPSTYQVLVDNGVKDRNGNAITFPANGFGNIEAQFGVPWTASGGVDAMKLAAANAAITTDQIKANIQKVYYQLVVGQKQLASLEANISLLEKLLNDTKELFKNGFVEKLDVDKTTVQLNNLQTEKEKVNNLLLNGFAGLKFLINMPQKESLLLKDTLSEAFIKDNILDESYDYNSRKEVQALTYANKLNAYNVKRYQLGRIPSLVAFASYSKNAQRTSFDFFNKGDWFTTSLAGIKMTIPIFDGFARRAKIENAKLNLQKTQNTLAQTKELVDYEVSMSRSKMKSALLTMDNQKQNIALAEKVYNTTKKKYEQGLGSNLEIFNAQTELKVAQNNYYNSLYDAITAKIDYLKAAGKL